MNRRASDVERLPTSRPPSTTASSLVPQRCQQLHGVPQVVVGAHGWQGQRPHGVPYRDRLPQCRRHGGGVRSGERYRPACRPRTRTAPAGPREAAGGERRRPAACPAERSAARHTWPRTRVARPRLQQPPTCGRRPPRPRTGTGRPAPTAARPHCPVAPGTAPKPTNANPNSCPPQPAILAATRKLPLTRPHNRAKDPASVHGVGRYQVEQAQHKVDHREIDQDPLQRRVRVAERLQRQPEETCEHQACRRADRRYRELLPSGARLRLQLADTAQQEKRDALHPYASPPGDDGVGELVGQHGREQQQRGDQGCCPVLRAAPAPVERRVELGRQAPRNQNQQQEPRIVETHWDARYASDVDGRAAAHWAEQETSRRRAETPDEHWANLTTSQRRQPMTATPMSRPMP